MSYEYNEILRPSVIAGVEVDCGFRQQVSGVIPPETILQLDDFTKPEIILPHKYPDFDSLVSERSRIVSLKLLPIKTSSARQFYHSQPKEDLIKQVEASLGADEIVLAPNQFPDYLPGDLGQFLIWTKRFDIDKNELANFIARTMRYLNLGVEDVIFFERSRVARQEMVRGTFPDYRHIHFWRRINKSVPIP